MLSKFPSHFTKIINRIFTLLKTKKYLNNQNKNNSPIQTYKLRRMYLFRLLGEKKVCAYQCPKKNKFLCNNY